ncbi:MAG: PEP-CTERM sorting domain-containing protein [Bryobacteraceae bacterium]
MKLTAVLVYCLLAVSVASAGTVTSLYGDVDCFGLPGVTSCPDGSLWSTGLGGVFFTDYRDPAEIASNSVTDVWAAPGDVSWTQPAYSTAGALSASFSIRIAGIADDGGPYPVLFDGTSIGSIPENPGTNAFQEVLTYTFSVPVGLLTGSDTIAINGTGGDGYIIDYAQLTVTNNATGVPEPATFGLLLLGFGAFGAARSLRRG